MVDFDDVDAGLVELGVIAASAPGRSCSRDAQPRDAPLADEVAQQHVGEQMRVDVAAGQDVATFLPAKRSG